ncbi:MAG TPA: DR2241 family protein [Candidatus Saccharimonadales bacterium]|nr:DR2241 family protein [Candidatus Saccharimonadales bacterium]
MAALGNEGVFGQVLIRRNGRGFELRHITDGETMASSLSLLGENEWRALAQFTAHGAFRPLKSAPTLRSGWRAVLAGEAALGLALDQLYPGAVADWQAARSPTPPTTGYREFTARQTGMYRITTKLDDTMAGAVIRACCHADFCLKRRLWSVEGLAPDAATGKSAIPCLEPCAILLEFARKIVRVEQDPPDSSASRAEAEAELQNPNPAIADSDFDNSHNPRRMRFILEKPSPPATLSDG